MQKFTTVKRKIRNYWKRKRINQLRFETLNAFMHHFVFIPKAGNKASIIVPYVGEKSTQELFMAK